MRKIRITAEKSWPLRDEYQAAQLLQEDNQAADADVGIDHVAELAAGDTLEEVGADGAANEDTDQA